MKAVVISYNRVTTVCGFKKVDCFTAMVDPEAYALGLLPEWMTDIVYKGEANVSKLDFGLPKEEKKPAKKEVSRFNTPWYISYFDKETCPLPSPYRDELLEIVGQHQVVLYSIFIGCPTYQHFTNRSFKNQLLSLVEKAGRFKGRKEMINTINRIPAMIYLK